MGGDGIRSAIEAATTYLIEHPDDARYTDSVATATLADGLQVTVEGPKGERLTTDMPTSVGGGGQVPGPGWLFRAALATCEVTLIAMRAAALGVELHRLEVVVDSESDDRGLLGMDDSVPPGPLSVRVGVRIQGSAGPAELREIAEWGVDHCPVCDATKRAVPVQVQIDTPPDPRWPGRSMTSR